MSVSQKAIEKIKVKESQEIKGSKLRRILMGKNIIHLGKFTKFGWGIEEQLIRI